MTITKQDFGNAKINESFGISDDVLVKYVQNNVPGSRWWRYWKDDEAKIRETFDIVRKNGMSAALLVVKEKAEGVGFTNNDIDGWGNHYDKPDPNPLADLANYAQVTVKTSNSTSYNPAWIDAGYPVNCVPEKVIREGNEDFSKTPLGTIKRAYVPMTAASTWAYYYPQALNASVNGISNYGNPMQQCTDYLNEMGAKITGTGGSGSGGSTPPGDNNDVKPGVPDQNKPLENSGGSIDSTSIFNAIKKAINEILDLLTQNYTHENLSIYGSKTGLMFTEVNKSFIFAYDFFNSHIKSITNTLNDSIKDELDKSGAVQDKLPNGINQTIEILLTRALKYVNSNVKYDESKNGNPDDGATDNARFVSWCVQTIHPSLKNSSHKDFFNKFNAGGYVRNRGTWAAIAKNLQIGDIVCCADNLTSDSGGKEYFIALGNDECVEAYPYENGVRSSKNGETVGKGVVKFKLSERSALGCADIALIRVYSPKEVENPTPNKPTPPSNSIANALNHISAKLGQTIGTGQCYSLCAEYSGFLGGPGLGAGTNYGLSGLSGQGSTSAASDIGICYNWSSYGWTVIKNPQLSQIVEGCILNINRGASVVESMGEGTSNWFTWAADPTYGHTLVVEKINGDSLTVLEQWGGTRQIVMRNTMKYSGSGASGISSICIPPKS